MSKHPVAPSKIIPKAPTTCKRICSGVGTLLFVVAVNLVVVEVLVRGVNAMYPLERPVALRDSYAHQLLEGGDWLNGKTRLYTYKPNSQGATHGHPFRVNRWGFRGGDFLERNQPEVQDVFRIMVLGDSVTSGIGIAEEDRYTDILERKLSERYPPPSRRIEVINLSVEGFETLQEEKIMRRMWDVVGPDLVVVGFYVNDPNTTYDYYRPYKMPMPERFRSIAERLLTFRVIEPFFDPLYRMVNGIPTHATEMWHAYDPDSEDWKLFVKNVAGIVRWASERTRRPPVVIFLSDAEEMQKMNAYDQVRETFLNEGYIWSEPPEGSYAPVSRFESHPNERSHRMYADALFKAIIDSHVLIGDGIEKDSTK